MRLFLLLLFVPSLLLSQKVYNYYDECDFESYRNELNNFTEDSSSILYLKDSKTPVNGTVEEYYLKIFGFKETKKISEKYFFVDGKKEDKQTFFYKNGNIDFEESYKNNKLDGPDVGWYKNGKLESEVKYNEGEIISERCFDNDGNKIECKE